MKKYKVKRSLSGPKEYRQWGDYEVGDVVVGTLIGWHKDNYGNDCPKIKVLDGYFKDGTLKNYIDKVLVLNSCGTLDKAMEDVVEGDMIQLEYSGTNEIKEGPYKGTEAHTMTVDIVEEDDGDEEEEEDDTSGL